MPDLVLVPILLHPQDPHIAELSRRLYRAFLLPVRVVPAWFDPEDVYDPSRGQYHSTRLLARLLDGLPAGAKRVLGVTSVDLFVPILTYVFGEAQLDGPAAVVSSNRLRPEAYGLPASPDLLAARLEKEAMHEVGHTCGLVHCYRPSCVMQASTYADDIDFKPAGFCLSCLQDVRACLP